MHLLPAILTSLVLLAAPAAGYLLVDPDGPALGHPAAASATEPRPVTPAEEGLLRLRVRHDGEPVHATLRIFHGDGATVEDHAAELVGGAETTLDVTVPVGVYGAELVAAGGAALVGTFAVSGSDGIDLAECPGGAAEVLVQTYAHASRQGIVVPGSQCLPGPERHVAMQRIGAGAVVPFPLCPLDCTMGYTVLNEGSLRFDVPEDAASIRMSALWDPDVPKPQGMEVWLVAIDGCGDGCNEVVAAAPVDGELHFEHPDPAPGAYGLGAHLGGPAGATADEYVWLMATVVAG